MANFVKLTNGDVVNTQHIKSMKRHEYASAGDWARAMHQSEDVQEGPRLKTTPAIELLLGNESNPLTLKYDSEQERNAEFARLESALLSVQNDLVEIDGKIINCKHLAALYVEYYRGDYRLVIKVARMPMDTRYCGKEAGAVMMATYKKLLGVEVFDRVNQSSTHVENE